MKIGQKMSLADQRQILLGALTAEHIFVVGHDMRGQSVPSDLCVCSGNNNRSS